jgi:predicted ATP-binding protein involved in virulence
LKLTKVRLENYRGFKRLDLDLHPNLTVIVGLNGFGKTTVMSAFRLLLWSYVRNYGKDVRRGATPKITADDIHSFQSPEGRNKLNFPCSVKGMVDFPEEENFYYFEEDFDDDTPIDIIGCELTKTNAKINWLRGTSLDILARSKALDAAIDDLNRWQGEEGQPGDLPVIAYYGTNRLWKRSAGLRKVDRSTVRFVGYDGATSLESSFMRFEWFILFLFSSVKDGLFSKEYVAHLWIGVREAIRTVTGWEWKLPKQDIKQIHFKRDTEERKLSQLGDGVRCMIELVGDLACRCSLLNFHYKQDAVKRTSGVVLIDEVDMHLHPSWQQKILSQLQEAFPKIQFIVTTHSPQVLSTVRRENIRLLERDASGQVSANEPLARTYGEPSGDILHSVMQVDPQPPVTEKADLQRLTELVDKGLYDEPEALQLTKELQLSLSEQHPQMQRLKRSIARQRVLKG